MVGSGIWLIAVGRKQIKELPYFKGIVSRDFGGLQMILMDRIGVLDVPLKVYSFLNFCFHIVIYCKFKVLSGLRFY